MEGSSPPTPHSRKKRENILKLVSSEELRKGRIEKGGGKGRKS